MLFPSGVLYFAFLAGQPFFFGRHSCTFSRIPFAGTKPGKSNLEAHLQDLSFCEPLGPFCRTLLLEPFCKALPFFPPAQAHLSFFLSFFLFLWAMCHPVSPVLLLAPCHALGCGCGFAFALRYRSSCGGLPPDMARQCNVHPKGCELEP